MFYVIYDENTKRYLNGRGGYSGFDRAVQFESHDDAEWDLDTTNTALRVVGPCIEGECP